MADRTNKSANAEHSYSPATEQTQSNLATVQATPQTPRDSLAELIKRVTAGAVMPPGDSKPNDNGSPTVLQRRHADIVGDTRLRHPMYVQRRAEMFLQLQRTHGNAHVGEVIGLIQGPPRSQSTPLQRYNSAKANSAPPTVETAESQDARSTGFSVAAEIQRNQGRGQKLDPAIRAKLEQTMDMDLGHVTIHADGRANILAQSVAAEAFTAGNDIYFRAGRYDPHSYRGRHLLAHELTHTVQQSKGAVSGTQYSSGVRVSDPDDSFERAAEHNATLIVSQTQKESESRRRVADLARWPTSRDTHAQAPIYTLQRQTTHHLPPIQRSLFGPDLTEREKIEKALASKDPGDVKDIKDYNRATENEKLDLIRILAYQGWVGPRDEWAIETIWGSFGDQVPRIMSKNTLMWNHCIEVGAELDTLPAVKKTQVKFLTDVQALALGYLQKNRDYVKEEMESLGLDETTPTPEQDKRLKEVQDIAAQVKIAQEKEQQLRKVVVGDEYVMPQDGLPFWFRIYFNPDKHPDRNLSQDEKDKDRDWLAVKNVWDPVASFITKVANQYPSIYAAIQQSSSFWGTDDKIAPIADATNPAKAREVIGHVLRQTLTTINESEKKILENDPDYRDLLPLHAQLLTGSVASPSNTDWTSTFNTWVVENDLKDYKAREFWIRLGLQTAAAAAFVVVEFATVGTATFFIAAGVGLAASGYQAYNSLDKYMALERASKTNVKDTTAIVDKAAVIEAGKKAIEDAAAFLLMVAAVAGKVVASGLSKLTQPKVPQGLTQEQFSQLSSKVRQGAGHLGDDIRVHGSRAAKTARTDSDLDIAIRVSPERFDELVRQRFGTPNPGSAKERTMLHAIETGKIQAGEAGVSGLRKSVAADLGMNVDISVVRTGGPFDKGPWIPLN